MIYTHAYLNTFLFAAVRIYAQHGDGPAKSMHALNSHDNYFVDHVKTWENHGFVFLNFCENPVNCFQC